MPTLSIGKTWQVVCDGGGVSIIPGTGVMKTGIETGKTNEH